MLTRLAHALLVSTSLAPVALVYGVSFLPGRAGPALQWIAVSVGLTVVCVGVLKLARRHGEREVLPVEQAKNVDKEVLAFLVSYALPLVAPAQVGDSQLAFWTFMALVAVVLYQAELVNVNPLLGILGYRFYEVPSGSDTLLLLARSRPGPSGAVGAIRLSDTLWLEASR